MRIIYDYYGIGDYRKTVELEEEDRPYILEYLKIMYPEWWDEPLQYPLPKEITIYLTNPFDDETVEFEINTHSWDLHPY